MTRRASLAWAALAGLFFFGLWALRRPGPDFLRYLRWTAVARTGDIFRLGGDTTSPFGVPFSHWAHGTGFVFSVPQAFPGSPSAPAASALLAGWVAGVVFWLAMYRLLAYVGRSHPPAALLGLALAFLGTHAGFYSFTHASESLSLALLALVVYWVVVPRRWHVRDALALGAAGGLLVAVRAPLGLYVVVALGVLGWQLRAEGPRRALTLLAITGVPIVIGGLQVLMVNRWMTGSVVGSPYGWGDASFGSLDFRHPELFTVLFHPWHGWLSYHPLYGVCLFALGLGLWQGPRARRALCIAGLTPVVLHVYLQSAHFAWWLGLSTFGMRGLAVTVVVLVPVFVDHLARVRQAGRPTRAWAFAVILSCTWSYLLLRRGETNFATYQELVRMQVIQIRHELADGNALPLIVCGAAGWWGRRLWGDQAGLGGAALFLSCLSSLALASAVLDLHRLPRQLGVPAAVAIKAVFAAVPALIVGIAGPGMGQPRLDGKAFEAATTAGLLLVLAIMTFEFGRVAVRVETRDRAAARQQGGLRYTGTLDLEEVEATYREYLKVPGFERRKAALRAYLDGWRASSHAGVP